MTTDESSELAPRKYTPPPRRDLLHLVEKEEQRAHRRQPSWYRDRWVLGQAMHLNAAGNVARYAECFEDVGIAERGSESSPGAAPIMFTLPAQVRASHAILPTIFMLHRLAHQADQPNIFCPSEGLTQLLTSTELRGALGSDIQWPYHTFAVELPRNFLGIEKAGHFYESRSVLVAHCDSTRSSECLERRGPYILLVIQTEINEGNDPDQATPTMCVRVPLPGLEEPLNAKRVVASINLGPDAEQRVMVQGREHRLNEGLVQVAQLVLNLALYLGSAQAEVRHLHAEHIARLTHGKSKKEVRKKVQERVERLRRERVFLVGSSVRIDPALREQLAQPGATGGALTYRTVVRGHWKRQVFGEGRSERKTIWIRPYVRGSEDLPQALVGHTYKVA